MNPEIAYECAACPSTFEDFEEAANCCGYGYYNVITCGECWCQWETEHKAEVCCTRNKMMIRFKYKCAGEGCGFASDDMQEALDHIDAAANTLCTSVICIAVEEEDEQ